MKIYGLTEITNPMIGCEKYQATSYGSSKNRFGQKLSQLKQRLINFTKGFDVKRNPSQINKIVILPQPYYQLSWKTMYFILQIYILKRLCVCVVMELLNKVKQTNHFCVIVFCIYNKHIS